MIEVNLGLGPTRPRERENCRFSKERGGGLTINGAAEPTKDRRLSKEFLRVGLNPTAGGGVVSCVEKGRESRRGEMVLREGDRFENQSLRVKSSSTSMSLFTRFVPLK